ncbi:expressed protein [Phakopsora pachyrhizi]|uniref:Expressed protein n=1 Tax=Phakopsora pachyrhizi TaxID=170000 RepID=A0AAV0BBP8_PHAPC|nr:expressed protein [Phakopsora pachyrhizi]
MKLILLLIVVHLYGMAKGLMQGSENLIAGKTIEAPNVGRINDFKHLLDSVNEERLDVFGHYFIANNLDETLNQSRNLHPITPLVFDTPSTLNHNRNIASFGDFELGDFLSIKGSLPDNLGPENLHSNQNGVSDYQSPQNSIYRPGIGNSHANKKRLPSDLEVEKLVEHGAFPTSKKYRSSDILPGQVATTGTNDQVHQAFDLVRQKSDLYHQFYQSPLLVHSDQPGSSGSHLNRAGYAQTEFYPIINQQEPLVKSSWIKNASNKFPVSITEVEQVFPDSQGYVANDNGPISEAESWLSNFPFPLNDFYALPNQYPGHLTQADAENYGEPFSEAESRLSNFPYSYNGFDTLHNQHPGNFFHGNAENYEEPFYKAESVPSKFPSPFHDSGTLPNQRPGYLSQANAKSNIRDFSEAESRLLNSPSPFHNIDTLLLNQRPGSPSQFNAKNNNKHFCEAESWLSNFSFPYNDLYTPLYQHGNCQAHSTIYPINIEIPGISAGNIQPAYFDARAPISPPRSQIIAAENDLIDHSSNILLNGITKENQPSNSAENLKDFLDSSDRSLKQISNSEKDIKNQTKLKVKELKGKKRLKNTKYTNIELAHPSIVDSFVGPCQLNQVHK